MTAGHTAPEPDKANIRVGCAAVLAAIVVIAVGYWAWWTFRPDLLINPIDRFTHVRFLAAKTGSTGSTRRGSFPVSMIPVVFSAGESGTVVIKRLLDAGYSSNGSDDGEDFYLKSGPAPSLACQTNYYVSISIDEQGLLAEARADTGSYCL